MPDAADYMVQGIINVSIGDIILLVTDGFYRIVETFNQIEEHHFVKIVYKEGLLSLRNRLRALEKADPDCTIHPRLKPSDDAAAALLIVKSHQ